MMKGPLLRAAAASQVRARARAAPRLAAPRGTALPRAARAMAVAAQRRAARRRLINRSHNGSGRRAWGWAAGLACATPRRRSAVAPRGAAARARARTRAPPRAGGALGAPARARCAARPRGRLTCATPSVSRCRRGRSRARAARSLTRPAVRPPCVRRAAAPPRSSGKGACAPLPAWPRACVYGEAAAASGVPIPRARTAVLLRRSHTPLRRGAAARALRAASARAASVRRARRRGSLARPATNNTRCARRRGRAGPTARRSQ
jgi:hypothetical protein